MKTTMTQYDFVNWFANSETRKDQFSRKALFALYDYLTRYEDSTGKEIEFDPIALCCEYTEYKDLKEFQNDYGDKYETEEDIQDRTLFLPIYNTDGTESKSFIIQAF